MSPNFLSNNLKEGQGGKGKGERNNDKTNGANNWVKYLITILAFLSLKL